MAIHRAIQISSCIPLALASAACEQRPVWYDFGNGLVNLSTTHVISSEAMLSAESEPRMKIDEDADDEAWVRYEAHEKFCHDTLKLRDLEGSIAQVDAGTNAFFAALQKAGTVEFLKACRVQISGRAHIAFDTFTLQLSPYDVTLDYSDPVITAEKAKAVMNERLATLAQGNSPWHDDYTEVLGKTKSPLQQLHLW